MPLTTDFRLPDLGEGLTEGEIVRWLVSEGDSVALNQPIVEIETAKAVVEIPSPHAGIITALLQAEGQVVPVGTPIISFGVEGGGVAEELGQSSGAVTVEENKVPTLVGYGPRKGAAQRRPRKTSGDTSTEVTTNVDVVSPQLPPVQEDIVQVEPVRAKPPVRKLARDLGIELTQIQPTGPNNTISRADVEQAAHIPKTFPDTQQREQRIPIRGVRKATAEAMVASAFTAPHTSVSLDIDMTRTMELRSRLRDTPEFDGIKVSPLLFVAKAVLAAVARQPILNATWDEINQEIVVKNYVNLGIAVATERGLVVPSIKDAQLLSTHQLAIALDELAVVARAGHATPQQLRGGTISITNIGVFGVDSGIPILPPGQAAILAIGAVKQRPWVCDGVVVPRAVATVTLSFDHRIVDGEQGARFVADVGRFLTDPELALLAWN